MQQPIQTLPTNRTTAEPAAPLRRLDHAIRQNQSWFFDEQRPNGCWHAPLEANVGMDAQYVILNRFLGRRADQIEKGLAEHILAKQSDDGSWPLYYGGPGHLSTTIEAYFALKLMGWSAAEAPLRRARDFVRAHGGAARAGILTRAFLAYFGQFPWWGLPSMPAELILLPSWFPINIYAMSSWARGTVVPLTVLLALRPSISIDPSAGIEELWLAPPTRESVGFPCSPRLLSWRNFFLAIDSTLKLLGRTSWTPLRTRALAQAERWILAHQEADGSWGGIQPPMVNSVMALRALGYDLDQPALKKGVEGIDSFLIKAGGHTFFQPCISPLWDTALAAKALFESGIPSDHPSLVKAAEWLIAQQVFKPGDWQVYNPRLEPGGWPFEYANDWYPDVDDSAVILMVLHRVAVPDGRSKDRAIAFGMNWTLGMQSRNGGWGAFDVNNDTEFLNEIPFADMKAMLDRPTEDLTGRVLEAMGKYGYDLRFERARRGHDFLLRVQRADGSWWGRWGANFIYGTWSVLAGLRAIGDDLTASHIRRAVAWLKGRQNPDGGWGETLRSYDDETCAGCGESTASQTAWALLGLLAGEQSMSTELHRGIAYLLDRQQPDGSWDEEIFTGTGFPGHFYVRYHMYRNYFPLMALGQYRTRLRAIDGGNGSVRASEVPLAQTPAAMVPRIDDAAEPQGSER